jgi:hypothetical protein
MTSSRATTPEALPEQPLDRGAATDEHARASAVYAALVPPKDPDVRRHRDWLARSSWPEVVFASAR